jgi:RimJ/RimL family protein N-acetyltransferase
MSVNTQAHNLASQRLYRHFGFRRNGYDPPVWSLDIEANTLLSG